MTQPQFIVMDLSEVLNNFAKFPNNYFLYNKFSVHDIVRCLLTFRETDDSTDTIQLLWYEIENRFSIEDCALINMENVDFIFEMIAQELYAYIRSKIPKGIDASIYTFCRWVDNTSLILKDDNAP